MAGDAQTGAVPVEPAPTRALASWVLFDWAAQPFYTLVLTFLFAPYFANVVAANAKEGTEIWGYAAAAAGVLVAILSPILGAHADGNGRRKPWMALFSLMFAAALAALWLAVPAADALTIAVVLAAFIAATIAAEITTVLTNAIMPDLVPPSSLGRLSGIGWAMGYAGGLISLLVMAGLLIADARTGKTLMGLTPVLPLDVAAHEGERLIGPFSAVWYLVFMIPFFLFVPDRPRAPAADRGHALSELWATLRELPSHRDMLFFLVARMIYSDGLAAIFTFGGIYGASVFGWASMELAIFGVVLIVAGTIGAVAGGVLDDRIGARTVIVVSLVLLAAGALGILSVDKTHILFAAEVAPKSEGSAAFSSAGEQVFLAFAVLVGLVAAPVQAASRSLLARLAPPGKMAQYFGLFAFSGKVTAFLAPFSVALLTQLTGSERIGMGSIVVFLALGLLLMLPVRERR